MGKNSVQFLNYILLQGQSQGWRSECPAAAGLVQDPQTADLDPTNMVIYELCWFLETCRMIPLAF